jgi:hypothetical protein
MGASELEGLCRYGPDSELGEGNILRDERNSAENRRTRRQPGCKLVRDGLLNALV